MPEKFIITKGDAGSQVDTQHKDGDPRKTAYTVGLMLRHSEAMRIYQKFSLMKKMPISDRVSAQKDAAWGHSVRSTLSGWERRKHFAPEHMLTVIAGCQALGQLSQERGLLSETDIFEIEQAAAIHDAGKELEFALVSAALRDEVSVEEYAALLSGPTIRVQNTEQFLISVLEHGYKMLGAHSKGARGLAAYDLAGGINELRLRDEGISPEILGLQKMVGHASCPEIDQMLRSPETLDAANRARVLKIQVIHYIDDIATNPNVIDPLITVGPSGERLNALDRRCFQNDANPKYREYNYAWCQDQRNQTGATAFEMQRRVGHLVEQAIANSLDIEDPLTLPAVVDSKIRQNMLNNWELLHKTGASE